MTRACPIPDHAELEFARTKPGTVHVLTWEPGPDDEGFAPVPITSGEQFAESFMARLPMLCGRTFFRPEYVGREDFGDDALCAGCVRALGDQSWRAFQ